MNEWINQSKHKRDLFILNLTASQKCQMISSSLSSQKMKNQIFLASKPRTFYSNHSTFCLEVMKTWTGIAGVDKNKVRTLSHLKTKERLKMKKKTFKNYSKVHSLEYWNNINTSLAIRIAIIFCVVLLCQALS